MTSTAREKYSVVDLFAGAGGLSYGFLQTGRYEVKAAFENNRYAQETYRLNHGHAVVFDDVAEALTERMKKELGAVDVVIGGPPCQGFSNANRQKNHVISQNSSLVKKFVQAVLHLNPVAFVMENVSTFRSTTHRFFVDESDKETIKKYGIKTATTSILLLDAAFMFDGVEKIVSNPKLLEARLWDENDYIVLNVIYKSRKNEKKLTAALEMHRKKLLALASLLEADKRDDHLAEQWRFAGNALRRYYAETPDIARTKKLCESIEPVVMLQRMLAKAKELHDNRIIVKGFNRSHGLVAEVASMAVVDYMMSILRSPDNGYKIDDGILSAAAFGAPQKRMRYVVIGVKNDRAESVSLPEGNISEEHFNTVRDAIADIECIETSHDAVVGDEGIELPSETGDISMLGRRLRDSERLYNHISTATTPRAMERFKAIKQGSNFHSLDTALKTTYSDPNRTQNTIYLRLKYDEPSGTVVNIRKSMWIHPVKDRALSVREAARLQTFPDSFVFRGPKDSQYQQVGNAVPPILARAIAECLCRYLDAKVLPSELSMDWENDSCACASLLDGM